MLTRLRCYNNRLCACGCCMTRGCLARWTSTRRSTARARWSFMCSFPWMTKRLSGCGSGLRPWCDNLLLIQKNLSRGLAPSSPLSFCQKNFSELKMQKAEHLFFRRCSALLYFFSGSMMRFSTFGLLQVLFAEVFNVFRPRYFATAPCSAEKFFR